MNRVFILSPARTGGRRGQLFTRSEATFELARQVRIGDAVLGDVFTFCSGLYFRGKLAYARRFAQPPEGIAGVQIITPSRGLLSADVRVGSAELQEFATVAIDSHEPRFSEPLLRSAEMLAVGMCCEVVLLGSVATANTSTACSPFPSLWVAGT